MPIQKTYPGCRTGLTLIEIMIAMTMIAIGVLGAIMYRYHSALDARKADVQVGACRVALLILEGWKGAVGLDTYNPAVNIVLNSPDISITSTGNNNYTVQLTGGTQTYYYTQLTPPIDGATNDIDGDGLPDPGLVKLEVEVIYYGNGSPDNTLPAKSVKLSDFVRTNE